MTPDQWGYGFEYFMVFLLEKHLSLNLHLLETPKTLKNEEDYHLTDDSIALLRDHSVMAPNKPFLTY